jgi:hypothetical protein
MSASSLYDIAMGYNAPPGLVHPILQEQYAWVDERLRLNYYSCQYDCDDCEDGFIPRPCPISWVDYRYNHIAKGIEEVDDPIVIDYKRKRAESDISDHEEELINAFKKMKTDDDKIPVTESKYNYEPLSNPFCNLDCENYNYQCSLINKDESEELQPELNDLFKNWNSGREEEEDNDSVKCDYFDSEDEAEDENQRNAFEEMMDGYDSDDWYIHLSYCH